MGSKWTETTIGDFCHFQYGRGLPKHNRTPGPYPVYGSNGQVGSHRQPWVNGPGIIIGRKGTVGAVHFSKEPFWPIDTTFFITEAEHRDLRFTYYLLRSLGLDQMNADSAVPGLNREAAHARVIRVPPLPEQRAIAHILSTLDDKIELNRRMNETLEAMAQALFKSWFVDFDPVVINAIKAGNPIPEKFAERAAHYRALLENPSPNGRGAGVRGKEKSKKEKLPPHLLSFARQLRKNQTNAEALLWGLLRGRRFLGVKFRRQHPVPPYILDFYSHETKLAIEVDGSQHNLPEQRRRDEKRTAYLAEKGIRVLRFWSDQVLRETEAVLERIYEAVAEALGTAPLPSSPLPAGEGGERSSRRVTGWVDGADLHLPPEDILRLFPDRFVDSELGPIPEGWEVRPLDKIARFQNGLALQKYRPSAGEARLPVVKIAQLRSGIADSGEWASAGIATDYIIDDGDVVFSWSGSLLVKIWCGGKAALNQHLFKVTSHEFPKWFYFGWIREHLPWFILIASDKATTMGHIKRRHLSEAQCAVPTRSLLENVDDILAPLLSNAIQNGLEVRSLATTRDFLLPKLVTGELRVQNVEIILEGAT